MITMLKNDVHVSVMEAPQPLLREDPVPWPADHLRGGAPQMSVEMDGHSNEDRTPLNDEIAGRRGLGFHAHL